MNSTIAFSHHPSIALLTIETMSFDWITNTNENYKIFNQLDKTSDFEYYYLNQILIIPDPIPTPRINWSKQVFIDNFEISCKGNFIAFLHFQERDNILLATSLTFPEYIYLKNNIVIL